MPASREGFIHVLYAIILTQFVVIAVLLGGYSNQYLADDYFRGWINSNYSWAGLLLQGQIDALLVGMSLGATVLLIQHVRHESELKAPIRPLFSEKSVSAEGSISSSSTLVGTSSSAARSDTPAEILAELEKSD